MPYLLVANYKIKPKVHGEALTEVSEYVFAGNRLCATSFIEKHVLAGALHYEISIYDMKHAPRVDFQCSEHVRKYVRVTLDPDMPS